LTVFDWVLISSLKACLIIPVIIMAKLVIKDKSTSSWHYNFKIAIEKNDIKNVESAIRQLQNNSVTESRWFRGVDWTREHIRLFPL